MSWQRDEVTQTLHMIEAEHLDIRTITLGVSLRDCVHADTEALCARVERKLHRVAGGLRAAVERVAARFAVPIVNCRIATTPAAIVCEGAGRDACVPLARTLDRVARELGVDFLGGFGALVHKGMTAGDRALIDALPEVLATTERLCSAVNVATTRAGINLDAVNLMGRTVRDVARATADRDGVGCARLVVFANAVEDNPFVAGAYHGIGEPDCVVNVGVSGPGVVKTALEQLHRMDPDPDMFRVCETIKRMAFKITRAGELVGRAVQQELGSEVAFGIVDLSLAPTPAVGDSVAEILEALGLERAGAHGSTAALALVTDAVKKGGAMASSYVGGLSGAFIPVAEDAAMARAAGEGALTLAKLEAMTAVCSVGLDMVALPGDTPPETLAAILADEAAIGVMNHKTTGCRLIPVPGKKAGEIAHFGGLLGSAPILEVNRFDCARFMRHGGRIPPPLLSLRN
jgi:hypothetical protein